MGQGEAGIALDRKQLDALLVVNNLLQMENTRLLLKIQQAIG